MYQIEGVQSGQIWSKKYTGNRNFVFLVVGVFCSIEEACWDFVAYPLIWTIRLKDSRASACIWAATLSSEGRVGRGACVVGGVKPLLISAWTKRAARLYRRSLYFS